jgi:hypothetical protein
MDVGAGLASHGFPDIEISMPSALPKSFEMSDVLEMLFKLPVVIRL